MALLQRRCTCKSQNSPMTNKYILLERFVCVHVYCVTFSRVIPMNGYNEQAILSCTSDE